MVQETAHPVDVPMRQVIQNFQSILKRKGKLTGIGSGFVDLDRLTAGFHPAEMVVVAARPSLGKTSFALNVAENAVLPPGNGTPIPTLF